jgi:hypothetical protein
VFTVTKKQIIYTVNISIQTQKEILKQDYRNADNKTAFVLRMTQIAAAVPVSLAGGNI